MVLRLSSQTSHFPAVAKITASTAPSIHLAKATSLDIQATNILCTCMFEMNLLERFPLVRDFGQYTPRPFEMQFLAVHLRTAHGRKAVFAIRSLDASAVHSIVGERISLPCAGRRFLESQPTASGDGRACSNKSGSRARNETRYEQEPLETCSKESELATQFGDLRSSSTNAHRRDRDNTRVAIAASNRAIAGSCSLSH